MINYPRTIYGGIDVSKEKLSVAIADWSGREDVENLGTFVNSPGGVEKLLTELSRSGRPVAIYFEAGLTGYGL